MNGTSQPAASSHEYSRTIISIKGHEYECKYVRNFSRSKILVHANRDASLNHASIFRSTISKDKNKPSMEGLVLDGTSCAKDMVRIKYPEHIIYVCATLSVNFVQFL
jgi:hypothetical protein